MIYVEKLIRFKHFLYFLLQEFSSSQSDFSNIQTGVLYVHNIIYIYKFSTMTMNPSSNKCKYFVWKKEVICTVLNDK